MFYLPHMPLNGLAGFMNGHVQWRRQRHFGFIIYRHLTPMRVMRVATTLDADS